MNTVLRLLAVVVVIAVAAGTSFAQSAGDYRSSGSGIWSAAGSWETFDGALWNPAGSPPAGTSGTITIQSGHTIAVDAPITINGSAVVVDGYLKDTTGITLTSGSFTFDNGSTYEYGHVAGTYGIPTSTWNTGSLCLITGVTTATTNINASQAFYNLTVNCPGWTGSFNFGWNSGTININGDVKAICTGTGRWQFCAPAAGTSGTHTTVTVNIAGNLVVDGSAANASHQVSVTSNGTSNGFTDITINVGGNATVTGTATNKAWTNFSISRGSQGATGTTTWNLSGDFSVSNATMQNSVTSGGGATPGGRFSMKKGGTQNMSFSNDSLTTAALNLEVANSSTVQLNTSVNFGGSNSNLILTSGKIVTSQTNLLTLGTNDSLFSASSSGYIEGPMAQTINVTSSTSKMFPIAKGGVYRPVTLTVTQSAATATVYTAEEIAGAPTSNTLPGSLDRVSTVRYYTISSNGASSVTAASVLLNYDTDDNVSDNSNLRIAKNDGSGNWVDLGGTGTANTTGTITSTNNFTDLTSGTTFVLADNSGGANALPVEMTSLSVQAVRLQADIQWATVTEKNSFAFEVERMATDVSGAAWAKVGQVSAAGTSTTRHSYSFEDMNVPPGRYEYRLKEVDRDGTFQYSSPADVVVGAAPKEFTLGANYPNPFNPSTNFEFTLAKSGNVSLRVFNVIGQEVAVLFDGQADAGIIHQATFHADKLPSGIYLSVLESGGQKIVRKMMLTK
ncbi:MAG TPA: T9SS type A sorting domain-containing protein [Bacteroidota bacterium]|nr:T9SS type A sorting domain-containing protein [Bacteroidota bacterium]